MREIKFQAFVGNDIIEGYPAAIYSVENICWRDGKIIAVNLLPCEWIDIKWIILREYTGHKDKNDREIYEGDLMKSTGERVREVIYDEYIGGFKFKSGADIYHSQHWEVIGNIYENPELVR